MSEVPKPSPFAAKVANVALTQFDQFHSDQETEEPLRSQIIHYYQKLGFHFESVSAVPWSAVFISFCVKQAGATEAEFKFAMAHARFVHQAINHPAAYRGVPLAGTAVNVGDIIQNNRGGNDFSFEFAKEHDSYESHSAIVVARDDDATGKFALTVGGNESDSIRETKVRLNEDGTVKQRTTNPFICVLKCLK